MNALPTRRGGDAETDGKTNALKSHLMLTRKKDPANGHFMVMKRRGSHKNKQMRVELLAFLLVFLPGMIINFHFHALAVLVARNIFSASTATTPRLS
jgi:uncharacterized membrane protein YqaE (UPF0057 family)